MSLQVQLKDADPVASQKPVAVLGLPKSFLSNEGLFFTHVDEQLGGFAVNSAVHWYCMQVVIQVIALAGSDTCFLRLFKHLVSSAP